jgi:serralysin
MASPILTSSPTITYFVEGDNVPWLRYVIDPGMTISDADSTTFASATISISGGFQRGGERLMLLVTDSSDGNISQSWSSTTGVLTLTSVGATATLPQWQDVLRRVGFFNLSQVPTTGDRRITFVLNDGTSDSAAVIKAITVTPVNDATSLGISRVLTDLGSKDEYAKAIMVLPNGKVLIEGPVGFDSGQSYNYSFAQVQYNTDGSLDTSFGTDGTRITEFVNGLQRNGIYRVVPTADGKTLVVGVIQNGGATSPLDTRWAIARYNPDGSLDTSFDGDGKLTVDYRGYSSVIGATVQADGKVIVVGDHLGSDGNLNIGAMRFNSDGSVDSGFGTAGLVTVTFATYDGGSLGTDVIVLPDGKILIATSVRAYYTDSSRGGDVGLVRLDPNGSLDPSFGVDGKVIASTAGVWFRETSGNAKLQTDGKILMVVSTMDPITFTSDSVLMRYNSDGSLDTSFSGDGKVSTGMLSDLTSNQLTLQPDSKILLVGGFKGDFCLIRYNTDGSPDAAFGTNGKVTTDFGSSDGALSVAVQGDGKIVVAGASNGNFAVARYNTNGSLDTSFTGHEQQVQDGSVLLDGHAAISDPELALSGYGGSTLTLNREGAANPNDVFVAKAGGTLGKLTEGGSLTVDGSVIGTVHHNSGGTLELNFTSVLSGSVVTAASQTLVNSVLQQLAYSNTVDPVGTEVQILWTFNDGNTGAQGPGPALITTATSKITIADTTAPTVTAFNPSDEAAGIAIGSNIVLTFNEVIAKGTGNILLKTSAGTTVATYDAVKSTDLSISGNTLTINPTADLAYSTGYKVEFAAGTIKDLAGNSYAGTTSYNFTTANGVPVATSATVSAVEDTARTGALSGTDPEGSTLTFAKVADPSHGTVTINARTGAYVYTPASNYNGADSFTFKVNDGIGDSAVSPVNITVNAVNDLPTGAVTISGRAVQGQTLAAANTLADADGLGTISYQWQAAGVSISGATANSYTLNQAEVGKVITVTASYTDASGMAESKISTPTSAVAANQTLAGSTASESFTSGPGNDSIDGGAGTDTLIYGGSRAKVSLTKSGTGFALTDSTGSLGTDTLQNVERIKFSDGSIALDMGTTQSAGQTVLLLGAVLPGTLVFDASKQSLLGAVIDLFDQGFTLQDISGAVMRLPIWDVLVGKALPTTRDIAYYLLTNVNGVAPDPATLLDAVLALNSQTDYSHGQGTFLWHLAESTTNQTHVGLVGLASTGLAYSV